MNIGTILKNLRTERHLSVNLVSSATNIPKSCIYDYESNKVDPPPKRYYALLDFYGINPELILKGKEVIDITNFSPSAKKQIWIIKENEKKKQLKKQNIY